MLRSFAIVVLIGLLLTIAPIPTAEAKVSNQSQFWPTVVCGQWEVEQKGIGFAYFPWDLQNVWNYVGEPTTGEWDLWSLGGQYAILYFPWPDAEGNLSGFARMVLTDGCVGLPVSPSPIPHEICGTLLDPYPVPPPPEGFGGGGMGQLFIPFGKERDPYSWFDLHQLGVYVSSQGTWWMGAENGQRVILRGVQGYFGDTVHTIESYTLVESCGSAPIPMPALVDNSAYMADVTIPDGTIVIPGQEFTKIWRVRNSGSTTWSTGYQLVYVSGERFGAPATTPLKADVAPGRQIDLNLVLKAPQRSGTYTGIFMLRNANSKTFGTKLTVVVKVPTFIMTYMEIDPAKPTQRQPFKLRVYYDLVGSLNDYSTRFNGEVLLKDSRGQVVERATYDKTNATFLPDAEALRKDPNFRKWVLTVRNVSFRSWSDAVTIEVWLRPLGPGSGLEYIKASLITSIQADPAAVTRCASFISKKLSLVAPSKVSWVLVGTGTSTRLATCDSISCAAWEIAQLIARTGGDIARTILAVLNINNMTGAEDCYRLAQ